MGKKWAEVPAGIINGATQRFWLGLDEDAGMVANKINTDPDYLAHLVSFAVSPGLSSPASPLLRLSTTINVDGDVLFVAEEKFIKGETVDGVSIADLGSIFQESFFGKVERDVKDAVLNIRMMTDRVPSDRNGIKLTHFFRFLAYKQKVIDLEKCAGYVYDKYHNLKMVKADWHPGFGFGGWYIGAFKRPVGFDSWRGCQIVSY